MTDTWNHRLVKTGSHSVDNQRIAVHEVFYKDGKPWLFTEDPVSIQGFSWDYDDVDNSIDELCRDDIRVTVNRILAALLEPILDGRSGGDFPDSDLDAEDEQDDSV